MKREQFGTLPDGRGVELYTLTNSSGVEARITSYGGTLVSLRVPGRDGQLDDVVLGYDRLDEYLRGSNYFGALVGRYGNRIAKGRFTLDGVEYSLTVNNGENHLHGGARGFDKVAWEASPSRAEDGARLELSYLSRDGEEGYPGNLSVRVAYTLTDRGELKIDYAATTDRDTIVNLTHHSYFNLAGQGTGDILKHQLKLYADRFTPVDDGLIPTGELRSVRGTAMDFTTPTAIGAQLDLNDPQIKLGRGYDHNWVLNGEPGALRRAATVFEPGSGRVMEVWTTEPGIQFYTGNYITDELPGKGGKTYRQYYGFCLETQHFPDSPNRPGFPSTLLRPGERYQTHTAYRFSVGEG